MRIDRTQLSSSKLPLLLTVLPPMIAQLELLMLSHASCRASQHRQCLGDAYGSVLTGLATGLFPFSATVMQSSAQH